MLTKYLCSWFAACGKWDINNWVDWPNSWERKGPDSGDRRRRFQSPLQHQLGLWPHGVSIPLYKWGSNSAQAQGSWPVRGEQFFWLFFHYLHRVFGSINAETKNGHVPTGKCLINDFIKLRRSSSVGKDTCYQPWGADFNLWLRTAGARTLRLSLLSLTSTDIQAVVTSTCSCTLPEESETVIIKSNLLFDNINFTLTNNKISTLYLPVLLYYNCFYLCTILN